MLTTHETNLLKKAINNGDFSNDEAVEILDALGKIHKKVAPFRRTYKVECTGEGCYWTISEKDALERFNRLSDKMQVKADKKNTAPEVVLIECCRGDETPVKKYVPDPETK